ncbi:hypothetical protein T484DRAFT_1804237 [Baffinella frigidus]|nr:hypothetical protein T484DRAFT_1804237 [Cryptophyta sp. CCMP2293]
MAMNEDRQAVLAMNEDRQASLSDLRTVIQNLRELEAANTGTILAQRTEIDGLHGRFFQMSTQLVEAERREDEIKNHFRSVGAEKHETIQALENHETIQALTNDMRFLVKKREDDYTNLTNQKTLEVSSWRRANENLNGQLLRFRSNILTQLESMNRRLTRAKLIMARSKAAKGSGITPRENGPSGFPGSPDW